MIIPIVLAILAAGGVILLFVGVMQTLQTESEFGQRLDSVMGRRLLAGEAGEKGPGAGQALAGAVDQALAKRGYGAKVQESLARADLKFTVGEYMVLRMVTTVIGAAVLYVAGIFNSGLEGQPHWFAVAGALIGYMAPRIWVSKRASGRIAAFNTQLPDTVVLLANALRSGNSVGQAMALASREAPRPTRDEFARVVQEMSLGLPTEETLANLLKRVPSGDLDMMITAMNVSAEVGGNLSDVLEKIGETIRERIELKGEIAAKTAQTQGTGTIVSILPVLIGLVIFFLNGAYIKPTFTNGFPYLCLPICAGLMIFMGFMAMRKVGEIEV